MVKKEKIETVVARLRFDGERKKKRGETNGNSAIIAARILREEIIKALPLFHQSSRKRALIIARYQICIRLHSARFFALTLLPFPYPFDINQFGRLLCVLRFIFLFFFSFCRKWIFGCFSSIREIFLFSFIEDSWNFISHVEILIRQIRISRKLIKRSVSVSCQGVW